MSSEFMNPHSRIARPVRNLSRSVSMYRDGHGLLEMGRFENHAGFDSVMFGNAELLC